ncbi:(2Fe-2S)-binding protein [uncultured Fibrella sp.]|uniref:(2Fe-2S)-binding protein n=1 Tax=uncultured Fibrella sp. TaxID=1284596 RepID=UPI0035CB2429
MADQDTYLIDGSNRRWFLKQSSALTGFFLMPPLLAKSAQPEPPMDASANKRSITLKINRKTYKLDVEPRETLLDLMRERLDLTGTKKGCDHGQCGACTVHVDGRQANACLMLAVMHQNQEITTIEGLAPSKSQLHPLQAAFVKHDGYQCGFCTPGQIMSGVAVLRQGHAGSVDEIREWMSGNICRCGAYSGIVDAIESVQKEGKTV